jgi:hypothetical protein
MTIWDILAIAVAVIGIGWFIYSLDDFIDEE